MCKLLQYSVLLIIGLNFAKTASAQSITLLQDSKIMDDEDLYSESIYYPKAKRQSEARGDLLHAIDSDQKSLENILHIAELTTIAQLKDFDKYLLSHPDVQPLLARYLNFKSINGITPEGSSIEDYNPKTGKGQTVSSEYAFIEGYDLIKEKELSGALRAFNKCDDMSSPYFYHARYYAGLINILQGDYQASILNLKKIGTSYELKNHLPYYLALSHFALKDYQSVVKWYAPRIKETQLFQLSAIKEYVAISYYKLNETNESIELLKETEQEELLLSALLQQERYDEVIKHVKRNKNPEPSIYTKSVYAQALHHTGKYQESSEVYAQLINTPHADEARYNIAHNHIAQSDYNAALESLSTIQNATIRNSAEQAISSLIINSDDVSIKAFNPTLIANLTTAQKAHLLNKCHNKGQEALLNKDVEGAFRYLSMSNKVDAYAPQSMELSGDIAWSYFTKGDYSIAKSRFKELSQSSAFNKITEQSRLKADYALSYIYIEEDRYRQALGHLSKAQETAASVAIDPKLQEDILNRMGDCYFAIEDYSNAKQVYLKALSKGNTQSDHALYRIGAVHKLNAKPYEQIITYEELIERFPNSPYAADSRFEIGNSYFELGQYDNAKKFYQGLTSAEDPALRSQSLLQLGLIYVNAGDYDNAEQYYSRILEQGHQPEYKATAERALKELYATYKVDADSYAEVIQRSDRLSDTKTIKRQFAVEQFLNGNYTVALEEFKRLKNQNSPSKHQELDHYIVQCMIKTDHSDALSETISFVKKYSPINHEELTSEVSTRLLAKEDFKTYIELSDLGWFNDQADSAHNRLKSLIALNRYEDATALITASKTGADQLPEEILLKIVSSAAQDNDWVAISDFKSATATHSIWSDNPKAIYIVALSQFNQDDLKGSIDMITENYATLISEPSWFAKATILLSDNYYIRGEKINASAALEAMLDSGMSIPANLIAQAKERLNEINL
jgi:tetratricopeptide (TPR) repeat protein